MPEQRSNARGSGTYAARRLDRAAQRCACSLAADQASRACLASVGAVAEARATISAALTGGGRPSQYRHHTSNPLAVWPACPSRWDGVRARRVKLGFDPVGSSPPLACRSAGKQGRVRWRDHAEPCSPPSRAAVSQSSASSRRAALIRGGRCRRSSGMEARGACLRSRPRPFSNHWPALTAMAAACGRAAVHADLCGALAGWSILGARNAPALNSLIAASTFLDLTGRTGAVVDQDYMSTWRAAGIGLFRDDHGQRGRA